MRAVAPFLAGSSGMRLRRFLPYDVLGAGRWGTMFALLGYFFWRSLDRVLALAKQGALALAAVIVLVTALVWLVRWVRVREHRRQARDWLVEHEHRPVIGPVVRLAMPAAAPPRASGPVRVGPRHARRPRARADVTARAGRASAASSSSAT